MRLVGQPSEESIKPPSIATWTIAPGDHLWGLAPEVRSMFPDDLVAQRQKLVDELTAIVAAVADLGALVARTAPLGARHVAYGVEPDHYELVGEALLAALAEVLGDGWDPATEEAWRYAYDLVAETMLLTKYHRGVKAAVCEGVTALSPSLRLDPWWGCD